MEFPTQALIEARKFQVKQEDESDDWSSALGKGLGAGIVGGIQSRQQEGAQLKQRRSDLFKQLLGSYMVMDKDTQQPVDLGKLTQVHDQYVATGQAPEGIELHPIDQPGVQFIMGKDNKPETLIDPDTGQPYTSKDKQVKTSSGSGEELSSEAQDVWAGYVAKTGGLPANMGFGMPKARKELLEQGAKKMKEQGIDPATQQQEFKAGTAAKTAVASSGARTQEGKVNQAIDLINAIDQNYDPKTDQYSIPPALHTELALGMARLLSPSGQVGVQLEQEIRQKTAREGLASVAIYLGLDPKETGGTTQSVSNFFAHSIARQGQTAEQLRNTYTGGSGNSFNRALANSPLSQKVGGAIPLRPQQPGVMPGQAPQSMPGGNPNPVQGAAMQSPKPGGVLHTDKFGRIAWVYPDGTYDVVNSTAARQ
jgi:hypothetical protein